MQGFDARSFADAAGIFNVLTAGTRRQHGWQAALKRVSAGSFPADSGFVSFRGFALFRSFLPAPVPEAAPVANDNATPVPVSPALSSRFLDPAHVPVILPPVVLAPEVPAPAVAVPAAEATVTAPVAAPAVAGPVPMRAKLRLKAAVNTAALAPAAPASVVPAVAVTPAAVPMRAKLKLKTDIRGDMNAAAPAPVPAAKAAEPAMTNTAEPAAKPRAKLKLKSDIKVDMTLATGITRRSSADDFAALFKAQLQLAEAQGISDRPPAIEPRRTTGQKAWDELTSAFKQEMGRALAQQQSPEAAAPVSAPQAAASPVSLVRSRHAFNLTSAGVPSAIQGMRPAAKRPSLAA